MPGLLITRSFVSCILYSLLVNIHLVEYYTKLLPRSQVNSVSLDGFRNMAVISYLPLKAGR